jgi:Uma2 family endonuclease
MAVQPKTLLTPEQYLEMDRKSDVRLEYYFGEVFDMACGTEQHSALKMRLAATLITQLDGKGCSEFDSDLRICVDPANHYAYADAFILCGPPQRVGERRDIIANPSVIFEVLSPSTEAYDRGDKFRMYRAIASLQEYVLISQKEKQVECFCRQPDGRWLLTVYQGGQVLQLETVDCAIDIDALYKGVELEVNSVDFRARGLR